MIKDVPASFVAAPLKGESGTIIGVGDTTWALISEMDIDEALVAVNSIKWMMLIIAVIGIAAGYSCICNS